MTGTIGQFYVINSMFPFTWPFLQFCPRLSLAIAPAVCISKAAAAPAESWADVRRGGAQEGEGVERSQSIALAREGWPLPLLTPIGVAAV